MSQPYVIEIVQGENLYETMTVRDGFDVSAASVLSVKAPSSLFILNLTATASGDDAVTISASSNATTFAPLGTYRVEVWAAWDEGSPTKAVVAEAYLVFREAADAR